MWIDVIVLKTIDFLLFYVEFSRSDMFTSMVFWLLMLWSSRWLAWLFLQSTSTF